MALTASHGEAQSHLPGTEPVQRGPRHLACFIGQTLAPARVTSVTEQSHQGPQEATNPIPTAQLGNRGTESLACNIGSQEQKGPSDNRLPRTGSLSRGWISDRHQTPRVSPKVQALLV